MVTKELLAKVRKIEIRTRRIVDELTGGAYHSVFKGKGIEFDEVREYLPGDDVRAIDWNVTARMGHPYIKKFVEERELTVMLLVDISASGDFGSRQSKNEHFAEMAALLAFSAIRNNDRVGLMLFSDTDELVIPPRKGRTHVLRLIREMLVHQRRSRKTDIRYALETFMKIGKRRNVVFIISDFVDDGFADPLAMVGRYHDASAIRIFDRREVAIPAAGLLSLEDAESGHSAVVHAGRGYARDFTRHAWERLRGQEATFRRAKVDLIDIFNGEDYVRPIMRLFREREHRRWGHVTG